MAKTFNSGNDATGWCSEIPAWWSAKYGSVPRKKPVKCLLPGCEKLTVHNGGYCSGDHCREHQEIRKAEKHDKRGCEG